LFRRCEPTFIEAASKGRGKEIQMKGNSKKLAVFVSITAIAMFTVVALTWADDRSGKEAIEGEYAMMSAGTCLFSLGGFDSNYKPIGASWPGSTMATGIWTFHRNGTGTVQGTAYQLTLPPNANPHAATQSFSFNFTYKGTDDDTITADMVGLFNATFLTGPNAHYTVTTDTYHFFGNISADHKTITLANGNEVQKFNLTPPPTSTASPFSVYGICNIGRVLTRLDE